MGAIGHDGLAVPGKVVLAHEPPFSIGTLTVDPATRQVIAGARSETLEPRVMEVLVALYRAGGIVTRDELIHRCWEGRVVGEDAINRVISRIRNVAAKIAGGSFTVETITKVGYRLSLHARQAGTSVSSPRPRVDRRMLIGGAAAASAAAALGWFWMAGWPDDHLVEARALRDRAIALRQTYDIEDNRQAIAFLQEAVRIAPEYGEAWGTLALAYHRALTDEPSDRVAGFAERLEEALRSAERFDPGNADADGIRSLGFPLTNLNEAEARARSFVSRHPRHPGGHSMLGAILMDVGRWHEALPALQAVRQNDPFNPLAPYRLAVAYWALGQISRAEEELNEAVRRWPQHSAIAQTRIKLLALTGRPKAALEIATNPQAAPFEETDYANARISFLQALVSRSNADSEKAVQAALRLARENPNDCVTQGLNCVTLGRTDVGLAMLEGVYLKVGEWAWPKTGQYVTTHPLFQPHARPLWRLPRFAAILKGVGLESYWRKSGSVPDFRRA